MKQLSILLILILAIHVQGQSGFSFQASFKEKDGKPAANKKVPLRFTILGPDSKSVFTEDQSPTTDQFGIVNVVIGTGGALSKIDFTKGPFTLRVDCDADQNGVFELLSTSPLLNNPLNQGPKGDQGIAGVQGPKGDIGPPGPKGDTGAAGLAGKDGAGVTIIGSVATVNDLPKTGNKGDMIIVQADGSGNVWDGTKWVSVGQIKGPKGDKGDTGPQGIKGDQGIQGLQGVAGAQGPKGDKGDTGSQGIKGDQGIQGLQGAAGAQGAKGDQGLQGIQGLQGPQGPVGATGAQGPQGLKGDTGAAGATGSAGPTGPTGPAGPQGAAGATGPAGTYTIGTGLSLVGNTLSNTGDLNAADDVTTATNFAGDVSGPASNLQIIANAITTNEIANGAVTGSKISTAGASNGQVLKYNGSIWAPAADLGGLTNTAGTGITITNGVSNSTIGIATGGVGSNEIATGAVTGAKISTTGATNGQVMKFNGSTWAPAAGGLTNTAGTGITITNGVSNSTIGIATGGVGTNELANGAVTGAKISATGASSGQVMKYNGSAWAPGADAGADLPTPVFGTYVLGRSQGEFSGGYFWQDISTTATGEVNNRLEVLKYFYTDGVSNISNKTIRPETDNASNCGNGTKRWGAVYAVNGTIQTSDIRQKKNIDPIRYGLEQVLAMKPVSYNWNIEKDKEKKHLGFIAQEMNKMVPEVVEVPKDEKNEFYGMKYAELVPVLVQAIQDQQKIIDGLKTNLNELKVEVEKIKPSSGLVSIKGK